MSDPPFEPQSDHLYPPKLEFRVARPESDVHDVKAAYSCGLAALAILK